MPFRTEMRFHCQIVFHVLNDCYMLLIVYGFISQSVSICFVCCAPHSFYLIGRFHEQIGLPGMKEPRRQPRGHTGLRYSSPARPIMGHLSPTKIHLSLVYQDLRRLHVHLVGDVWIRVAGARLWNELSSVCSSFAGSSVGLGGMSSGRPQSPRILLAILALKVQFHQRVKNHERAGVPKLNFLPVWRWLAHVASGPAHNEG